MFYKLLLKKRGVSELITEYEGDNYQQALDGFAFYSDPDNGYTGAYLHQVFSEEDSIILRTTSSPSGKGECFF